jgi:hypothetical protein
VPEGLPFDCSAATLARADRWNLVTAAGRLDIAFTPSGTRGFEDLQSGAIRFDVFGVEILASDLPDIIRSKEAADRPQDRQDVIVLREILRRTSAADGGGFAREQTRTPDLRDRSLNRPVGNPSRQAIPSGNEPEHGRKIVTIKILHEGA